MNRQRGYANYQKSDWIEKVVQIKRTSKKTKGGNKIGFTALVVTGNGRGKAGFALGKARDVASAIRKGMQKARAEAIEIPLAGRTIPCVVKAKFKAARVILKPARPGTGIIAGSVIRLIAEVVGIKDLTAKILGSPNKNANIKAVFKGLLRIKA